MPEHMYPEMQPAFAWAAYSAFKQHAKADYFCAMYGGARAMQAMRDFAGTYLMGGEL